VNPFGSEGRSIDDHRQEVVEVVRHPAGKPGDRLHLLRAVQLLDELALPVLGRLALGDVGDVEHYPAHRGIVQPVGGAHV
jgi:hypothetical protein